jgi:hypothetical protein
MFFRYLPSGKSKQKKEFGKKSMLVGLIKYYKLLWQMIVIVAV